MARNLPKLGEKEGYSTNWNWAWIPFDKVNNGDNPTLVHYWGCPKFDGLIALSKGFNLLDFPVSAQLLLTRPALVRNNSIPVDARARTVEEMEVSPFAWWIIGCSACWLLACFWISRLQILCIFVITCFGLVEQDVSSVGMCKDLIRTTLRGSQ